MSIKNIIQYLEHVEIELDAVIDKLENLRPNIDQKWDKNYKSEIYTQLGEVIGKLIELKGIQFPQPPQYPAWYPEHQKEKDEEEMG